MPRPIHRNIERTTIALIVLGVLGMFQPLNIDLYTWGFNFLLVGTLAFIVISHFPVRDDDAI
jgi:hypothetical protein